jgi:hypothetical protein
MYERKGNFQNYISSNKNVIFSMSEDLNNIKPYNGIYVKKNKVILSHLIDKVSIGNDVYKIGNFITISSDYNSNEYLQKVENNIYTYCIKDLKYTKEFNFMPGTDILYIEYNVENNSKSKIDFEIIPFLTYRDIFTMKKSNLLKFTNRIIDEGVLINLSVIENASLVIKSDIAEFKLGEKFLNNLKHEYVDINIKKNIYIEDVYIPGTFNLKIKPNSNKVFRIYISDKDINTLDYIRERSQIIEKDNIKQEFIELKKLATAVNSFNLEYLTSTIPCMIDIDKLMTNVDSKNINKLSLELIDIVKSIDGQYLVLNKIDLAIKKIKLIIENINIIDLKYTEDNIEFFKLKLWTVEIINKLYDKENNKIYEFKPFITKVAQKINEVYKNKSEYYDILETIVLSYNALKIYENILNDNIYVDIANTFLNKVNNDFWIEENKILKSNLNDKLNISTPEMLYAISLSYPLVNGNITVKLLDTIFKELYTPYGLRLVPKNSTLSKGLIYPKYMAHFVKANLRQNGVTYASQKISYNLVKELLNEIDKECLNSTKSIYNEKGIDIDFSTIDILTISEMIRLYDMLT